MDDKRVYFRSLLQKQKKSGKSINAFCRDTNIGSGQFHYWKQQLNNEFYEDKLSVGLSSAELRRNKKSTPKDILLVPLTINKDIYTDIDTNTDASINASIDTNIDVKSYTYISEVVYPNGVILKLGQSPSQEELITLITLLD